METFKFSNKVDQQAMMSLSVYNVGAAIEKEEQGGRALIEQKGVKVYSLARIKELRAGNIKFE